jgi:hypothetical protein
VQVGMKIGIAAGVVAGLGAAIWTTDHGFNRGPATGAIVPASLGGAALGTLALGVAARDGWRWAGSPALTSLSHASGPLAVAALGGVIGIGAASSLDALFPSKDGENPGRATVTALGKDAARANATAASTEANTSKELKDSNAHLDHALEELDGTLEANGGRMGAAGTVGEGRLDVTGLSPEQAAQLVFDAYAPGHQELTSGIVRVNGENVFSLPWISKDDPIDKDELTQIFRKWVDTAEPKGTLSAEESRRWQLGEHRETLTRGEDGS